MISCFYKLFIFVSVTTGKSTFHTEDKPIFNSFGNGDGSYEFTDEDFNYQLDSNDVVAVYTGDFTARERIKDQHEKFKRGKCDPNYPFRTADGSCNNLKFPKWGASNKCFLRFRPSFYEGKRGFRKSVIGKDLPNARQLSLNINPDLAKPSRQFSYMFSVYGQLLAHDLSKAPPLNPKGCCQPPAVVNSRCMPIELKSDDPFYSLFNVSCLALPRTEVCSECHSGKIEQLNGQTSFIDASIVYGATTEKMNKIRRLDGTGKLKSEFNADGDELLPRGKDKDDILCTVNPSKCFIAGDSRVNVHATLSSLQTVLMREHNRIASELKSYNPFWLEERLFQEARKIVGAELQIITFRGYLPQLLGRRLMTLFGLDSDPDGHGSSYDPDINPSIRNEFTTGFFRALHSMTPQRVGLGRLKMQDTYTNPELLRRGHAENLLAGACMAPSMAFGRFYTTDLTEQLLRNSKEKYGKDLAAQDIQRGRDHGLAPYVHFLDICSQRKKKISSFDDLEDIMSDENIQLLRDNYESVEDVDLIVGAHLENKAPGAELGLTTACVVAKQFFYLKHGDRFFWENKNRSTSFTEGQLQTLKTCSLSKVLCDNAGQSISTIQLDAFLLPSFQNPMISCDSLAQLDFSQWAERKTTKKEKKKRIF